jgi:D-alanine-D-alanine ligase-like ATP-grasp enzyme
MASSSNGKNGYELPKKVAIIYSDVKRDYFPTEEQYITEKDAEDDAKLIASYLRNFNIGVRIYSGNSTLGKLLRKDKPEMVINLVDSVKGVESLSSAIPGVLELLEIPYTGGDILGISLTMNKFLVKKLLQQNCVPVPHYQLFNSASDYLDPSLRYPLISKLNEIHGAVEITEDAVSDTEKHLRERLKNLIQVYK